MTKEIELTQGQVTIVDDKDHEWLSQWKWHADPSRGNFYARRNSPYIDGKQHTIKMHREILGLKCGDGKIVDHINRDTLNNTRVNLRIVSASENNHNHDGYSHNTSGSNGVCWNKSNNRWQAFVRANRKQIFLGYFDDINDAVEARRLGEIEHWSAER